jgi:hypothetical protein
LDSSAQSTASFKRKPKPTLPTLRELLSSEQPAASTFLSSRNPGISLVSRRMDHRREVLSLIHRADVAAVDARVKIRERNHLQPDLESETGWK